MLIKQRGRGHRVRVFAIKLYGGADRMGRRVRRFNRHDQAQMLDLRIAHHIVQTVDRGVRHIRRLQAAHPVLKGLAHETRIELQPQGLVFVNAVLAWIEPRVCAQLRRVQRRDQALPELLQR